MGDPAGVGPEIIVKAWSALRAEGPRFMVIGDAVSLASASGGAGVMGISGSKLLGQFGFHHLAHGVSRKLRKNEEAGGDFVNGKAFLRPRP